MRLSSAQYNELGWHSVDIAAMQVDYRQVTRLSKPIALNDESANALAHRWRDSVDVAEWIRVEMIAFA